MEGRSIVRARGGQRQEVEGCPRCCVAEYLEFQITNGRVDRHRHDDDGLIMIGIALRMMVWFLRGDLLSTIKASTCWLLVMISWILVIGLHQENTNESSAE